jgi:hypothetical protein
VAAMTRCSSPSDPAQGQHRSRVDADQQQGEKGVTDGDDQPVIAQQARDRLAPGLGGGLVQQPMPALGKLLGECVVPLATLEVDAELLTVEAAGGGDVLDDRREARDELDVLRRPLT